LKFCKRDGVLTGFRSNGLPFGKGRDAAKLSLCALAAAVLLAGCGGGTTNDPPGDEQQSPKPNVMDAGVVFGGASGTTFVPFSSRTGVPPVAENADVAVRALIANDTLGQPIQRVWMTLPDAPDFTQTLSFQPSGAPDQASYTYTTGTVRLPLAAGPHKIVLHALDSGNDEGTGEFTVQVSAPAGQ
jgi:hypothetical protein